MSYSADGRTRAYILNVTFSLLSTRYRQWLIKEGASRRQWGRDSQAGRRTFEAPAGLSRRDAQVFNMSLTPVLSPTPSPAATHPAHHNGIKPE